MVGFCCVLSLRKFWQVDVLFGCFLGTSLGLPQDDLLDILFWLICLRWLVAGSWCVLCVGFRCYWKLFG